MQGQWGRKPGTGSPSRSPRLSVPPLSRLADWQQTATEHLVGAKRQASRSLLSTRQGPRQTGACWLRGPSRGGGFLIPAVVGRAGSSPPGLWGLGTGVLQAFCRGLLGCGLLATEGRVCGPLFHPWGGAGQGVLLPRSLGHQAPSVAKNPPEKLAHLWVGKVNTSLSLS